jgi:hypothetical protein
MKKIMFNDRYGLTQAVLDGRKTMTRRIIPDIWIDFPRSGRQKAVIAGLNSQVLMMDLSHVLGENCLYSAEKKYQPKYYKGDEVAVAQAYSSVFDELEANVSLQEARPILEQSESAGWDNKMFVRADLMPHRICVTNIKVERLQDISEEDCMKEGIYTRAALHSLHVNGYAYTFDNWSDRGIAMGSDTAKGAFASLIDRISGKGTYERNPWCFCYEFELVKMGK